MTHSADIIPLVAAQKRLHDRLALDLARLDGRHRRRRLSPRQGIDFASNDYLGLAESPVLRAIVAAALDRGKPVGAGGSRLLRGPPEHETLEAEAAAWFGAEAATWQGRANLITLHTCGKALRVEGALICASGPVRDMLINRARALICSSAPSPLMAAAVRGALALLHEQILHALIAYAHDRPGRRACDLPSCST